MHTSRRMAAAGVVGLALSLALTPLAWAGAATSTDVAAPDVAGEITTVVETPPDPPADVSSPPEEAVDEPDGESVSDAGDTPDVPVVTPTVTDDGAPAPPLPDADVAAAPADDHDDHDGDHDQPDGGHDRPDGHDDPDGHDRPDGHDDPDGHDRPDGHDDPDGHGGQPTRLSCAAISPTWQQLEVTGHPVTGTYVVDDVHRTVQVAVRDAAAGGKTVSWTADGPIDAVILRSGQDAATYEYEPAARRGSGLTPPLVDRDGRNLAAVIVCYEPDGPDVEVDLRLADSVDPVDVGDDFVYLLTVTSRSPLAGGEVAVSLPPAVSVVDAGVCTVEDDALRCIPSLAASGTWRTSITVTAGAAGSAVARAVLTATAEGEPVVATSAEVTRIVGRPGHGCDTDEEPGHDEGHDDGHDGGHDDGHDECPGAAAALAASCAALDPTATSVVLEGPFANRRYLVSEDGVRIWVTVREASGIQEASWTSNLPLDAVFTRTGRDVADVVMNPPLLAGAGIVGPPGGSGRPRPMADIGFCWVERPAVDVGVRATGPMELDVGEESTVEVSVEQRGHGATGWMSLQVQGGTNVAVGSCGGPAGCPVELDPWETLTMTVPVTGLTPGSGAVVIELVAPSEPSGMDADNTTTLEIRVPDLPQPEAAPADEDVVLLPVGDDSSSRPGTSVLTVRTSEVPAELPATGLRSATSLLLAAIGLLGVGGLALGSEGGASLRPR